jgi:hypothetical protein
MMDNLRFYPHRSRDKRLTADTVLERWPKDAKCHTGGCNAPPVVFHWFNHNGRGKFADNGYDWFYCLKHDQLDPYGTRHGAVEPGDYDSGIVTVKVYKVEAPTKLTLKVEVD